MRGKVSYTRTVFLSYFLQLQGLDAAHPKGDRFFAVIASFVSGSLCHDAVMVIDVAVRMGIKVCQPHITN
jgi:hypothetical protein